MDKTLRISSHEIALNKPHNAINVWAREVYN